MSRPKTFERPKDLKVHEHKLFIDANPVCVVCGERQRKKLRLDHIIALARGGKDEKGNWQVLCNRCNSSKCDKDNEYWLRYYARVPRPSITEIMSNIRRTASGNLN